MFTRFSAVAAAFVVVVVQAIGTCAAAQGPDDVLARVRARLAAADPIVLSDVRLQAAPEPKLRQDAPWNGFLIGAVLGAAIGFSTYTPCEPQPPAKLCEGNLTNSRGMETVAAAALFGAVGLTVDLFLQRSPAAHRAPAAHRGEARQSRRVHVTALPDRLSARVVTRF